MDRNIFFSVIGIIFTIGRLLFGHHRNAMEDKQSRKIYIDRLNHPAYFDSLKSGLDRLQNIFGDKMSLRNFKVGWRGFFVCVGISLVYGYVSFVIGWMREAPGALGSVPLISDFALLAGWLPNTARGVIMLGLPAIVFLVVYKGISAGNEESETFDRNRLKKPVKFTFKLLIVTVTVAVAVVVAVAVAVAVVEIEVVAVAGVGAGALAVAMAAVGTLAMTEVESGAGAGALAVPIAIALAGVAVTAGLSLIIKGSLDIFSLATVLFLVVLPVLNGAWDWLSLSVTRWLGEDILKRRSGLRAIGLALIDVTAALLFLVTFATVLILGTDAFIRYTAWEFDFRDYLTAAAKDPGGKGFWASFMLFSTLFPTAAHFTVALFSVILLAGRKSWRLKLAGMIESGTKVNYLWPAVYFASSFIVSGLMVIGGFWGLLWLIGMSGYTVSGVLLDYALWLLDLIGG